MATDLIGNLLKEFRKKNKLSVQTVTEILRDRFQISTASKTLYGWEVGRSQPEIGTFLALCQIYGITSSDLNYLGYQLQIKRNANDKITAFELSIEERQMIRIFRELPLKDQDYVRHTFDLLQSQCVQESQLHRCQMIEQPAVLDDVKFAARNASILPMTEKKKTHLENLEKNIQKESKEE